VAEGDSTAFGALGEAVKPNGTDAVFSGAFSGVFGASGTASFSRAVGAGFSSALSSAPGRRAVATVSAGGFLGGDGGGGLLTGSVTAGETGLADGISATFPGVCFSSTGRAAVGVGDADFAFIATEDSCATGRGLPEKSSGETKKR
jgi:hypothetical protein